MSVATEYPPTVFVDVSSRPARPLAAPAVSDRPRLRLVPPAPACPAGSGRSGAVRRGGLRVVRRGYLVPVGAGCATPGLVGDRPGVVLPGARPVRLTRRGAVVLALGVALLGGLMLLAAHLSLGASAGRPRPVGRGTWRGGHRAGRRHPVVDRRRRSRRAVTRARSWQRLREVNHLSSASLTPGQTLKVG